MARTCRRTRYIHHGNTPSTNFLGENTGGRHQLEAVGLFFLHTTITSSEIDFLTSLSAAGLFCPLTQPHRDSK